MTSRYILATLQDLHILLSIILSLCPCISPLLHILHQKVQCPFSCFSISSTSFIPIMPSLSVCTAPIFLYSSSLTTQNLPDLSVLQTMMLFSFIIFFSDSKPSNSSLLMLLGCASPLHISFLNSSKIWSIMHLLISIRASSLSFIGLGNVTRLHSAKSVTLRFLSSNTFSTGSNICLHCASNSSTLSFSSFVISTASSSSSVISSFSFVSCILVLANDSSLSRSSASFGSFWITENLGCIPNTSFTFSVKSISPSTNISTSLVSISSYLFLSKILRCSKPTILFGISFRLSSSSWRYFFLKCSTFFLYLILRSILTALAAFLSVLICFLDFLLSSPVFL